MSMKIRYKKIIRSTSQDVEVLIYNILVALNKPGYRITKQTENSIEFKDIFWRADWNFNAMKCIDGGKFEMDSKSKTIRFSFYLSPYIDIFWNLFSLTLVVIQEDFQFLYFNLFFVIMFVVRFLSNRSLAYEMMEQVVNSESIRFLETE